MTRKAVYSTGLLLTLVSTVMTIASIATPRWVSLSSHHERKFSMGLHKYYSGVTDTYTSFPRESDCLKDRSFCDMWRTVGFLLSFDVVIELCTLVAFVVIIAGGVQRRTAGWKIVSGLLFFAGFVQCVGMALVAYLFNNDDRFFEGWYLDSSWTLCTASWSILVLSGFAMIASALYLAPEGDYELIPDDNLEVVQDEQLLSRIGAWNDNVAPEGRGSWSYQSERSFQSERD